MGNPNRSIEIQKNSGFPTGRRIQSGYIGNVYGGYVASQWDSNTYQFTQRTIFHGKGFYHTITCLHSRAFEPRRLEWSVIRSSILRPPIS